MSTALPASASPQMHNSTAMAIHTPYSTSRPTSNKDSPMRTTQILKASSLLAFEEYTKRALEVAPCRKAIKAAAILHYERFRPVRYGGD